MKYQVFVTPPSGVGGEWPRPARWNVSKRTAELYAAACRAKGMKARVTTMEAPSA